MRRFLLGVTLLTALLLFGLWIRAGTDRMLTPISHRLQQASQQCLSGDLAQGQALAEQAQQDWDSVWRYIAVFTDHAPMDEIDGLFGQLNSFYAESSTADFAACCARLSQLVRAVADAHSPSWWNIL